MLNEPVNKRYRADGCETIKLTEIQIAARDRINSKLLSKKYQVEAVACYLCGCKDHNCISEKDIYGLPVRVVMCSQCGLMYNNPRIAQGSLLEFYSEDYRELDRVLPNIDAYFELERIKGERIYKFLQQNGLLPQLEGRLVIEIGCGAGGILGCFKQAGFEVLGCDLVPHNLEFGNIKQKLDLHYGTIDKIVEIVSKRRVEVGLIIYEQVFEHLTDPSLELKKLYQVMGLDTLLFIGVPGVRNIDMHYESDLLKFLQLPHLIHFDLEHLVALARLNHFEFLTGNETAQAVFKKATVLDKTQLPNFSDMKNFITELERRRVWNTRKVWVCQLPHKIGRMLKMGIQCMPIPAAFKNALIKVLCRMRRKMGNY